MRGLAHRMNNILTVFHGHVGLLLDQQDLAPKTRKALHVLEQGARTATALMDRTYSLARPSAIVWREIDLGEFVRLLRPGFATLHGSGTVIEIDAPADLPHVWGDATHLRTAIVELVRNACEATSGGGRVQIKVRAEQSAGPFNAAAQAGCWVSLKVSDNGPGIPAEAHGRIFAPFFSLKPEETSFGLGLTVALGLVQQLGGTIRYTGKHGRTEFEMLLPVRRDLL